METRRSKRFLVKESTKTTNILESPVRKKKKSAFSNSKKNNSDESKVIPSSKPIKSAYFDTGINFESSDGIKETRTRNRKIKSSYFESPVVSEDSAESEYEPESPVSQKIPKINNILSKRKNKRVSESDSENSSGEFVKKSKSSKNTAKVRKNDVFTTEPCTSNISQKIKNSYESESDSSSDEFVKAPDSLLELQEVSSCKCTATTENNFDLDEDSVTENNPVEYFDFTPLLSQVADTDINATKNVGEKKSDNKKEATKSDITSDKKWKRSKKSVKTKDNPEVKAEPLEVFELLAMGENTDMTAKDIKESVAKSSEAYEIPKQVEILLDAPKAMKKKRCNDLEIALKRRLNNIRRENQVYIHKVHVLCLIAHGNYINSILNSADVLCVALSLLPSEKCYPPKRMNIEYLEDLMNWFNKKVKIKKEADKEEKDQLAQSLQSQFQKLEAKTKIYFCFMFICLVRSLGIQCRLTINLNVVSIKPTSDQLLPINPKTNENEQKSCSKTAKSIETNTNSGRKSTSTNSEKKLKSNKKEKIDKKPTKSEPKTPVKAERNKKDNSKNISKSIPKSSEKKNYSAYFRDSLKGSRRSSRIVQTSSKYVDNSASEEELSNSTTKQTSRSKSSIKAKSKISSPKAKAVKKNSEEVLSVEEMSTSDDSDDDFEEVLAHSRKKKKKIDRRVLSSEDETTEKKVESKTSKESKVNYWIEVFLEAEEKWFCVDIVKKSYHCVKQLYNSASHPVRYILGWNNDQTIKDVTRRYVPQYLTVTRKLRIDENWWNKTMAPYKPPNTPQNREEDEELEKMLEEQPLPASISEYKNHPMYALKRHLLKFQAIYPSDAPTLGFIRGEPVYSRLCVHQLHGREMWIKEAKVVKINETPYKIVKGRPQKSKFGITVPPKDLELFGSWQVEDYVPPTAENGKVPRNAFGNVELFKPSMLPKGTVYLQVPGLQKIANKLGIDCAAAIVGFDYSTNGWSYPVKDGFVVCEEFKDVLLDAYNQELEEAEKKEKQKREERVYSNWKRLIKGLYIREKLKRKYNFGDPGTSSNSSDTSSKTETKKLSN